MLLVVLFLAAAGWGLVELFVPVDAIAPKDPLSLRPARNREPVSAETARLSVASVAPAPADPGWAAPSLSPRWQYIVVHHTATVSGNAAVLDRYFREERKLENGLAYHFLIGNGNGSPDGAVEVGKRWTAQQDGGHVRGDELNRVSIGVCLVGDFTYYLPTKKQIASLKSLLNHLMTATGIPPDRVRAHCRMPGQSTVCPGPGLPVEKVVATRLGPPPSG